uniref:Si:dkey-283j8.1 n=1 Tax=Echeneis naucrates TaxID=173247 RepID=A0A665T5A7_ECHNA
MIESFGPESDGQPDRFLQWLDEPCLSLSVQKKKKKNLPWERVKLSQGVTVWIETETYFLIILLSAADSWILMAAIIFLSVGIITSFVCLVIDGACIVLNMDMRPLRAERCQYYSSGTSYVYENFYTSVSCWNLMESCTMTVRSGTCYCCDLYNCANGGYLNNYYEFVGVQSCEDVFTLYILIWTLTGLNLVAFFTGILTTAVLGSIKNKWLLVSGCVCSEPGLAPATPHDPETDNTQMAEGD